MNQRENNNNNGGIGIAIILGAIILFAFDSRADVPHGTKEKLVWADECPDNNFRYDENCKKRIYIDDSIKAEDVDWDDFNLIAQEEFFKKKTWKDLLRAKFHSNKKTN